MDLQDKAKGIFRARLATCGLIQIPGIDFNESFALVTNGASFQKRNLEASILDLGTAFLHGEFQEENCMNVREGMSYDSKNCLLLIKTIYGLVTKRKRV
jgi:hypothetical protein